MARVTRSQYSLRDKILTGGKNIDPNQSGITTSFIYNVPPFGLTLQYNNTSVCGLGYLPAHFYLSLNSCEYIFCQTSIHFCCCAVRGFPGFLKDRVRMSRSLVRNVLITSIVFQSATANRALFPSRMKTPAYI